MAVIATELLTSETPLKLLCCLVFSIVLLCGPASVGSGGACLKGSMTLVFVYNICCAESNIRSWQTSVAGYVRYSGVKHRWSFGPATAFTSCSWWNIWYATPISSLSFLLNYVLCLCVLVAIGVTLAVWIWIRCDPPTIHNIWVIMTSYHPRSLSLTWWSGYWIRSSGGTSCAAGCGKHVRWCITLHKQAICCRWKN